MKKLAVAYLCGLTLVLSLFSGCGGSSGSGQGTTALDAGNLNLIFVVSPDLAYHTPGDINPDTANLSDQGLQRSLRLASYLKQQLLDNRNVTAIYALTPTTHLQTANKYPDMTALGYIQQFALLNQTTLTIDNAPYTANNVPINTSYVSGALPANAADPAKTFGYCPDCRGLVFDDVQNSNGRLITDIIKQSRSNAFGGYYVFSSPWETTRAMLDYIDQLYGSSLMPPTSFVDANQIYVVSITPAGQVSLHTYDSKLDPPTTYPVLPAHPAFDTACTPPLQPLFSTTRSTGVDGAVVPANSNVNETVYIIRHAEAHPDPGMQFEDGNYVGAGQWRALDLPNALQDKIKRPNVVYSVDPAQWYPISATRNVSYVRPSLTAFPYAVANNLPYYLVSSFSLFDPNQSQLTSNFFFTGGRFSNKTVLVAWESGRIRPMLNALLNSYGEGIPPQLDPTTWPSADYDTIWRVQLDANGNLTVDDSLCEGIDTGKLPVSAPQF